MNASEESAASETPSSNTYLERFRHFGFDKVPNPPRELGRLLSTRSALSTNSSLAQEEELTQAQTTSDKTFLQIGKGQCAEIFSQPGANKVMKRAYPGKENQLWHDCCCHVALQQARIVFGGDDVNVLVPKFKEYVTPVTFHFWKEFDSSFSATDRTAERRHILVSQRIHPLQERIRVLLINAYCSPEQKDQAIDDIAN